jgi:hypothetical protein
MIVFILFLFLLSLLLNGAADVVVLLFVTVLSSLPLVHLALCVAAGGQGLVMVVEVGVRDISGCVFALPALRAVRAFVRTFVRVVSHLVELLFLTLPPFPYGCPLD